MTDKSDYSPDEWQLLLDIPPLVGTAVMMSAGSGLGTLKEAFAIASGVLGGRHGYEDNQLIQALIQGRLKHGERSGIERMGSDYRKLNPSQLSELAFKKCEHVAELLSNKSTEIEAWQYKEWSISVGQKVAEAAKEGGFLGIGGERVSPEEERVLEKLTQALDLTT